MLSRLHSDDDGFSLVELLVVLLIIGILATIAVPAFLAQRTKAQDADAKSFARSAQIAMETFWQANSTYVGATAAALQALEPALKPTPRGPVLAAPSGLTATAFVLTVTSKTTNTYRITRALTGASTRTCTRPDVRGSCGTTLKW